MVANAGTIEVATIADVDGHVTVEVWLGEEPPHRHGEPIYDGLLQVRDAAPSSATSPAITSACSGTFPRERITRSSHQTTNRARRYTKFALHRVCAWRGRRRSLAQ